MAIEFKFDGHSGHLDWSYCGDNTPLTAEEARIVAESEKAAALRFIGEVMTRFVEEFREAHLKDASFRLGQLTPN